MPAPAGPAAMFTCKEAPSAVVEIINASFTNGEHLEHAQAVEGPQTMTYVGGNIFDPSGTKLSSQDSWVLSDGVVYALTSDARRHTVLLDGRDLEAHFWDWAEYNDAVGKCVGDVERAANQGR